MKTKKSVLSKKVMQFVLVFSLLMLAATACFPVVPATHEPPAIPTPTAGMQTTSREAQVQSVEIQTLTTNPPQVNAIVRGNLTESCATLGESQVQYASNTFHLTIYAVSPTNRGCAQVVTPYETAIALKTSGLPDGTYTVMSNGVGAVFALPVNVAVTATSVPTESPTATSVHAPTSSVCTDSAQFVSDVTIPDNAIIAANTAFTKTWRVKNTGSCTWDSSYLVAYISGATMSQQPGYWIVQPGQTVAPGQTADISVGMTSPVGNGNYESSWGLKNANGQFIPIQGGANGNSFYVKIKVADGNPTNGNITAASIDIELEQGSGAVCTPDSTYLVHAYITADGPTAASYEIGSTAGQIPAGNFTDGYLTPVFPVVYGTVIFDQAGSKTISYRFVGPYPYPNDITVNIRVNGGEWHNIKLSCQ